MKLLYFAQMDHDILAELKKAAQVSSGITFHHFSSSHENLTYPPLTSPPLENKAEIRLQKKIRSY